MKSGYFYLATPEGAARLHPIALGAGATCFVLSLLWLRRSLKYPNDITTPKIFIGGLALPVLAFFLAFITITNSLPMMATIVAGKEVEVRYTVARTDGDNSRDCRTPIQVEGVSFLFDELCGFPLSFRSALSKGDVIVVRGTGTFYGLFPEEIRKEAD